MKKHFLFTCMAVIALLMGACNEEENLKMQDGNAVTFNVSASQMSTRAVGEGKQANKLYWGVYDHEGKLLPDISNQTGQAFTGSDKVRLTLAQDKSYSIIFWAANADNSMCNVNWENRKMTVNPTEANQEAYDAFCAYVEIDNISGYSSRDVKLYRPFAQLNIGTADYDKARKSGLSVVNTMVEIEGLPTEYDFVTGKASDGTTTTFTYDYPTPAVDVENDIDGNGTKEVFPVEDATYDYLSMNYLLVGRDPQNPKELVTVTFKYIDDDNQEHTRTYSSVPVQRNWRTNIYGNILTSEAEFTVTIVPEFGDDNEQDVANIVYASTADEVLKALSANEESIRIVLLNDITLPGGTTAYTTTAKEVVIESNQSASTRSESGKKFTLTFKDSYRTYFGLANEDAKVTFNNVNIHRETTNTDTHWHNNNMKFTCNAEFNNVDFNKGICFDNAKTFFMNNCSINKGKVATYALFITAGCNVTIDGLSVTHSEGVAGRGIKIVDEDVAEKDALTTLSVSNATFVTEEKAAILVGSKGGAMITLSNLDLSGVKADGFNAVWIDEDYKGISVEVEGGFCVTEGETQTEDNNPFLVENGEVNLPAGTFVMPTAVANGVTIIGAEDGTTVLDMTGANPSNKKDLTFKNVTINVGNEIYHGMAHTSGLTYDNCVINGTLFLYSTAVFNNCTFNVEDDNYNVWTYGSTEATFNTCTFNCDGKSVLVYNEGYNGSVITMNTCQFSARAAVEGKAAVEIDSSLLPEGMTYVVNLNGCTVKGFGLGSVSNEMLFNQKKGSKATIYVDGVKTVSTEAELKAAIKAANNTEFTKLALTSKTFTGAFDIDGKSVELVALNRHKATIDGLVFGLGASHIKLNGIKLTNAHPVASESPCHKADYYCLGAYAAEFVIDDCVFDVNNQGQAAGKGAINIGDGFNANQNPYELTVTNTVFNCNGERPIRAKTRSYIQNCTFNDQHRYAIQVQGNEQAPDEVVVFRNNIINNPCQTSGELFAAGVSISKSQKLSDAAFTIEGNIMNSTEFANLKFVYDNHDNVKITTCTLNGKTIVEDQCVSILNEDEAKEVILDFNADLGTYCATEADFTAALNAGKAKIVLAPGTYEGTYAMKDGVTIQSMDDKNMATVDCINLNGAENITLKNIKFDAATAKAAYDKSNGGTFRQYANIISGSKEHNPSIGARNLTIEGCTFTGTFKDGGVAIAFVDRNRSTGGSGNITITGCTFETEGGYYDIYGYYTGYTGLGFVIEGNTFSSVTQGKPVYLGRYKSNVNVELKDNVFNNVATIEDAVYVQPDSGWSASYDASGNTFAQ